VKFALLSAYAVGAVLIVFCGFVLSVVKLA
jgi:hypothetical protein